MCIRDRYKLRSASRYSAVVNLLIALLALGLVLNVNIGSADIPVGEVFGKVWDASRYKVMDVFTGDYACLLYTSRCV